jgi:hypothetical protein
MLRMNWDTDLLVQSTVGEIRAYVQRKDWYAAQIYNGKLGPVEWIMSQIRSSHRHVIQNLRSMYVRKVAAEAALGKRICNTTRK